MRIDIISAVPELMESAFAHSIIKRAADKGLLEIHLHHLRNWGMGKSKQIDDYPFGGGAGMVLCAQPLSDAIESLKKEREYEHIIYTTPDGETLKQRRVNQLSLMNNLMIICGHYKGIDERIRERYVTLELSIGDYVLSGGELAAAVIVDSIGRLIPGVLNDETSALFDSFQDDLLAPPVYTRPAVWDGLAVPEILTSGHQQKIDDWRDAKALERTTLRRPDLL
jgi:tRNA (guanine37-N1)-methyltransferase